ncbi:MAG TPA: hypothetical protein VK989_07680, partial [Polyangia bacterium]|nr:hypothetical protein [Polyangia bacterium]
MKGISFDRFMIGLLFTAVALTACLMPAQSDTYWHLRAGQDLWLTHHVPLVEHYSLTAAGRFWPNHEWLWQAFSYALYRVGGMPLLTGAAASIIVAAFALVERLMVGAATTRFALLVLGVPIGACVWALRPQIVSLALLAMLVTLLARERYRWLPLLFVFWANVHGAVALGGAVLAASAALAAWRARSGDPADRRRAWALVALTPICALATAATPLGPRLWPFILESMRHSHATMIAEWLPVYAMAGPVEIAFWVLAPAFVLLLWRRWRSLRTWSDVVIVAAAVVVLPLAVRAVRNVPPFLLLAMPAASRLLGPTFRLGRAPSAADVEHPRLNAALLALLALAGVGVVAFAWATCLPMLGWRPFTPEAIAAVRACRGPLYNRYNEGGFLIWFVPERPVFIDSRQDPYPHELVMEAGLASRDAKPQALIARWGLR